MVVMILEKVSPSLRGELTRWMVEPRAGVFVGSLSGLVRDKLWEKVCNAARDGGCILIHSGDTEQGYALRTHGSSSRRVVDLEGLFLIQV